MYLGPILSLAYYGLIPYTMLSVMQVGWYFDTEANRATGRWGTGIGLLLSTLYAGSAAFTRWMLNKSKSAEAESPAESRNI